MRIRVLELPTQSDGAGYRVPWIMVMDDVEVAELPRLEASRDAIVSFGGLGLLVFKDRVELGEDAQ